MSDYPFDEIVEAVERHAQNGFNCYQKFTCEKCGERLTMDIPNMLFERGTCDKCGHISDIRKNGCNYLLHAAVLS